MEVVIVESPSKAKTINKYLGPDFTVLASFGHIRDLPSKDGSVRPDEDFAMIWEMDTQSRKRMAEIVEAVKAADGLVLATDPDREGEAISWHLIEVLESKKALKGKAIKRVAFNAITKSAVTAAMQAPREVDQDLVDAYLARRALDYLVGFTLSPVLWRKLPGSRSAGRVQSVALRLICERELEIEKFIPEEYWTIDSLVQAGDSAPFSTRLVKLSGEKLTKFSLADETRAMDAKAAIEAASFTIEAVQSKPTRRNPPAPFTTSTLQQEASRKLGFNAQRTMRTAQRLYEGISISGETTGLITYMRTDGIDMAAEAVNEARRAASATYGEKYLPKSPRMYKSKAKNAQEAHECIRPTSFSRSPEKLKNLDQDQYKLYSLIWKRALASQMETALFESTTIDITSTDKKIGLRATGSVLIFDGFLKLYEEGRDDTADEEGNANLPKVTAGTQTAVTEITPEQHFTQPPPRFSEASLVKRLEELGIGRPSTYASIISVLQDRSYVVMEKNRFIPDSKGRIVTAFLENFFERYVEYDFTANLEQTLDQISDGKTDWKQFLEGFWREFNATVEGMSDLRITEVLDGLNVSLGPHIFPTPEDGSHPRQCPTCKEGQLSLKIGRFGAFIGCERYPDCRHTKQLSKQESAQELEGGEQILGVDPESGKDVHLKSGRFGPYIQLGEPEEGTTEKPKRGSIPKSWPVADITLEKALMLINLPREVGAHPEDGVMIETAIGRFGPYVKHNKTYANLANVEEVFEIGLNRAVSLIADKIANPRGRGRAAAKPMRELGPHPDTDEPVNIYDGRYGPYVKYEKTNATIPRGIDPQNLTLDEAVQLIAEKQAKGPARKTTRKKATKKKSAAKKTSTKKAGTKKAGTKKAGTKKAVIKKTAAKKTAVKKSTAKKTA